MKKLLLIIAIMLLSSVLFSKTEKILGETFVATMQYPTKLAYDKIEPGSVEVRNVYNPAKPEKNYLGTEMVIYEEGKDYVIDYEKGTISRCEGSRIPDYINNSTARMKVFNHSDPWVNAGNWQYITYIDYTTTNYQDYFDKTHQGKYLPKTLKALKEGKPIRYVAYGDSITAFGGCTDIENTMYYYRWVHHLENKFKNAKVTIINGATGGDTSAEGVMRLEEKCLKENPDLVSIAFGMNDNNTISGIDQAKYEELLQNMVDRIKAQNPNCEIIILSSFHPRENWFYNSHQMDEYTKTAEKVAKKNNLAFVNIDKAMEKFFEIKGQPALLDNNINHPTDFANWIFYKQMEAALF